MTDTFQTTLLFSAFESLCLFVLLATGELAREEVKRIPVVLLEIPY